MIVVKKSIGASNFWHILVPLTHVRTNVIEYAAKWRYEDLLDVVLFV